MTNAVKGTKGFVTVPFAERFWAKVEKHGEDECWPWRGSLSHSDPRRAYGRIWQAGRQRPAHRVAWEIHNDRLMPIEMEACHTCDNPRCCNPRHVFPGTRSENIQDASNKGRLNSANARKTHCPQGHEYTPENTWTDKKGTRNCRICTNARRQAYR